MRIAVIYESLFGNTARIARAVAAELERTDTVTLLPAAASFTLSDDVDLLIVGGPTHGWGMSRPQSVTSLKGRSMAADCSVGVLRTWLRAVPGRRLAAAFDTRFRKPRFLTGSASLRMQRVLARGGHLPVVPPVSFFVQHTEGPLFDGEETRAAQWARSVRDAAAARLAAQPLAGDRAPLGA